MTLKFLKDTALEWVQKLTEHPYQKIQWIVTVPAIWSDAAKDTMRKAAMKVNYIQIDWKINELLLNTLSLCIPWLDVL